MDLLNLNLLPEWEGRLQNRNKGEEWKWKEELQIGEALYNQWREVFNLVSAFAENLPEEEDELLSTRNMIALTGNADAEHKEIIEEALTRFKELFRQWVSTFNRDEIEDDWGVF